MKKATFAIIVILALELCGCSTKGSNTEIVSETAETAISEETTVTVDANAEKISQLEQENEKLKKEIQEMKSEKETTKATTIATTTAPKIKECPAKVELTNKAIQYQDSSNWVFYDYVLFTFKIYNDSDKDIRGISGVATFNDMFGKEIIKVNCDLTQGVSANSTATDKSMSLEVNEFKDEHMKLRNTSYEDIQFEYKIKKIVYADGTSEEFS